MAILDNYKQRGQEYARQLRQAKAQVQQDKYLSVEGKTQQITQLEAQYKQQVAELRAEAEGGLTRARGGTEKQLQLLGEKQLEARRALLGDMVLADIYRRQLEAADAKMIARAYEEAATEWERQVIAGYGVPILEMQLRGGPSVEALKALDILAQAEPEDVRKAKGDMRDIDDGLNRLDELDVQTYNAQLADRLGVNAAYMAEAEF